MKKKVISLLVLAFFVNTTNAINWGSWWPFSTQTTKNLSSNEIIFGIIKNCGETSFDAKFNLERFLEKEQPRTVYEWIKILKINYALSVAIKELAKINATPATELFEIPDPKKKFMGNQIAALQYWNKKIQEYRNQRASLEPRLSFLPNASVSFSDNNFITSTCADQIIKNLETTFPYLAAATSPSSPLPTDQLSIMLQLVSSLPSQKQTSLQSILEKTPTNLVVLFFQLWGLNSEPTQEAVKSALFEKIAETAWQNNPDVQAVKTQKDAEDQALNTLKYCHRLVETHDYANCDYEESILRQAQAKVKNTVAKVAQLEAPFKQQFSQNFRASTSASLAIPSSLAQTAIRYLASYYPGLA